MVLTAAIHEKCAQILGTDQFNVSLVSGGDINQAARLDTSSQQYFIKYNSFLQGFEMLNTEARGLSLLASASILETPEVLGVAQTQDGAFLLLEYINQGRPDKAFWKNFGEKLAQLHLQSAQYFGLEYDNFIGRLPQSNTQHSSWSDFYANERLLPQLRMAKDSYSLPPFCTLGVERLCGQLEDRCPNEPPALIHGDLWRGNFLCAENNTATLIDPAPCFAHREMDLAMARLFGGFDEKFFQSYQDCYPTETGLQQRIAIYQIYYLLVHLNLFGKAYLGEITRRLKELGI